jgi:hypothetical protein
MDLPFLHPIPLIFCYAGLLAWGVTFIGLLRHILGGLKSAVPSKLD